MYAQIHYPPSDISEMIQSEISYGFNMFSIVTHTGQEVGGVKQEHCTPFVN